MTLERNQSLSHEAFETVGRPWRQRFVSSSLIWLRKRMLGISADQVAFENRGFVETDAVKQNHLERIGLTFLSGYGAALESRDLDSLARVLNTTESEMVGFAFEGAAMALTLLDMLSFARGGRLKAFLAGPGSPHTYMVHVGAGWAFARVPWRTRRIIASLDPLLSPLAFDGFGFHEGYFRWPTIFSKREIPAGVPRFAKKAFDQGLGRSLWFVTGANINRIKETIARFPAPRQPDLWSGVSLASAYAGGVDRAGLEDLLAAAAAFRPQLAQGACFAAKARERANNPAPHTELACQVYCGLSAEEAAAITDAALSKLPPTDSPADYEAWRAAIHAQFA